MKCLCEIKMLIPMKKTYIRISPDIDVLCIIVIVAVLVLKATRFITIVLGGPSFQYRRTRNRGMGKTI